MNLRSALELFSQSSRSCEHGAVRFLFWWLFLHRRLRSRQRGSTVPKNRERLSTQWADQVPWASLVFIRVTKRSEDLLCKPFGFGSERLSSGFPLLLLSSYASPHQLHLLVPVKVPVSNLDCDAILHQSNLVSSRKYFNFCRYFTIV